VKDEPNGMLKTRNTGHSAGMNNLNGSWRLQSVAYKNENKRVMCPLTFTFTYVGWLVGV